VGSANSSEISAVNDVRVVGRLTSCETRDLPSGDRMVSFRVVVDRPPRDRGPSGRVTVDAIECTAWRFALQRKLQRWRIGDPIEVTGALRRRFWRSGPTAQSRLELQANSIADPRRVRS
jgi:single-strand DNA-binding protein